MCIACKAERGKPARRRYLESVWGKLKNHLWTARNLGHEQTVETIERELERLKTERDSRKIIRLS